MFNYWYTSARDESSTERINYNIIINNCCIIFIWYVKLSWCPIMESVKFCYLSIRLQQFCIFIISSCLRRFKLRLRMFKSTFWLLVGWISISSNSFEETYNKWGSHVLIYFIDVIRHKFVTIHSRTLKFKYTKYILRCKLDCKTHRRHLIFSAIFDNYWFFVPRR